MNRKKMYPIGAFILNEEINRSSRIVDSFIYSCSHGIRSPLKTMEGVLKLLKEYPVTSEAERLNYMRMLRACVNRMESVMGNFQNLLLNTPAPLAKSPITIKEIVEKIITDKTYSGRTQKVRTTVHVNQKAEFISEPERVTIILEKIIENAIQFQDPRKEGHLFILVTSSASGGSIQVMDNGIGIDSAEQQKIFDLFYRGTNRSAGTGMGLYIARQLVDKLKGTIRVNSVENEGTTVSIWLPNHHL